MNFTHPHTTIHYVNVDLPYPPQHLGHAPHPHVSVSAQFSATPGLTEPEKREKKRPRYTRSRTGCLTCRSKKIKCDETKPRCLRCANGHRDCVWPKTPAVKTKPRLPRKVPVDESSLAGPCFPHDPHDYVHPASSPAGSAGSGTFSQDTFSTASPEHAPSEYDVRNYTNSGLTSSRPMYTCNINSGPDDSGRQYFPASIGSSNGSTSSFRPPKSEPYVINALPQDIAGLYSRCTSRRSSLESTGTSPLPYHVPSQLSIAGVPASRVSPSPHPPNPGYSTDYAAHHTLPAPVPRPPVAMFNPVSTLSSHFGDVGHWSQIRAATPFFTDDGFYAAMPMPPVHVQSRSAWMS